MYSSGGASPLSAARASMAPSGASAWFGDKPRIIRANGALLYLS